MKIWHVVVIGAFTSATALAFACGSKTNGGGGGGDAGPSSSSGGSTSGSSSAGGSGGSSGGSSGSTSSGGSSGSSSGGSNGCDDYFTTVIEGCLDYVSPAEPASEIARVRARADSLCAAVLALPGIHSPFAACTAAIASVGCSALDTPACTFMSDGTRANGSACVSNGQCQQGACSPGASTDGGVACGTCATPPGLGQPCTGGQSCGPNAVCNPLSGGVCVAVTSGGAGASCDYSAALCNLGLYCDPSTQACATLGGAGAPCAGTRGCTPPLVCPVLPVQSSTCQNRVAAGGACGQDTDCASGLGCVLTNPDAGPPTGSCATVSYVAAGQACGGAGRCLVGSCPAAGKCPTVIPDGQPCTPGDPASTCDTLATCRGGSCGLQSLPSCP